MYVPILVILGLSRRRRHFFSSRFSNANNFRPEVDSDIISGVVVDPTGVKVRRQCGDSRSNRLRDIRLPHFVTNDDDEGGRRFA